MVAEPTLRYAASSGTDKTGDLETVKTGDLEINFQDRKRIRIGGELRAGG